MEKEKSRKRGEEEEGEGRKKKVKEVPTEEEVEEFFAILRRMKVAVKYFERSAGGNGEGWRSALETDEVVLVEEDEEEGIVVVDDEHNKGGKMRMKRPAPEETEALDLNAAAPEEGESNTGA